MLAVLQKQSCEVRLLSVRVPCVCRANQTAHEEMALLLSMIEPQLVTFSNTDRSHILLIISIQLLY